jgi:hypothetical protein
MKNTPRTLGVILLVKSLITASVNIPLSVKTSSSVHFLVGIRFAIRIVDEYLVHGNRGLVACHFSTTACDKLRAPRYSLISAQAVSGRAWLTGYCKFV